MQLFMQSKEFITLEAKATGAWLDDIMSQHPCLFLVLEQI